MRLINTSTIAIHEFLDDRTVPPYAILSHTWGNEECTLQEMSKAEVQQQKREGYRKILLCCQQTKKENLNWAWVDTCCIDKTSTAELSEAINSMFRYYQSAEACYVYLSDVSNLSGFTSSRWFTRGWTLQELVAPRIVVFYTTEWQSLGSKSDLWSMIQSVTSIPKQILVTCDLDQVNIATKMSWAARRQTTRVEDLAYCLMGIFRIHMPLLYGEGYHAFVRLQQEIIKAYHDPSILLWGLKEPLMDFTTLAECKVEDNLSTLRLFGHFATSPSDFTSTENLVVLDDFPTNADPTITGNGLRITLSVMRRNEFYLAVLPCTLKDEPECFIAIPLLNYRENCYSRLRNVVLVHATLTEHFVPTSILIKQPTAATETSNKRKGFTLVRIPDEKFPADAPGLILEDTYWLPHARFDQRRSEVTLHGPHSGPHGILFLSESTSDHPRKFAIVLGGNLSLNSSEHVWVAFVRIHQPRLVQAPVKLRKRGLLERLFRGPDEVLPAMSPESAKRATQEELTADLADGRATKEQLVAGLVDGTAVRSILRPMSIIQRRGLSTKDYQDSSGKKRTELTLEVYLNKDRANLVEDTTFVFIRTSRLDYYYRPWDPINGTPKLPKRPKYPKWWEIENQGPLVRQSNSGVFFGPPTVTEVPVRPYPARLLSRELSMHPIGAGKAYP